MYVQEHLSPGLCVQLAPLSTSPTAVAAMAATTTPALIGENTVYSYVSPPSKRGVEKIKNGGNRKRNGALVHAVRYLHLRSIKKTKTTTTKQP